MSRPFTESTPVPNDDTGGFTPFELMTTQQSVESGFPPSHAPSSNKSVPAPAPIPMNPPMSDKPPFQEFQQILGFLASIGLATTATSAFSLVGATSLFGDTSPEALSQLKQSALFLSWASACFIVALVFIIAPQLLYTELVIVEIIMHKEIPGLSRRFIRVAMGSFAWIPLGFQMAALYLLIQAMEAFSPGPVKLARYGMTSGAVVVIFVTLVAIFSEVKGRQKILGVVSGGTLTICEGCHKVVSTQGVRHRCSVSL